MFPSIVGVEVEVEFVGGGIAFVGVAIVGVEVAIGGVEAAMIGVDAAIMVMVLVEVHIIKQNQGF